MTPSGIASSGWPTRTAPRLEAVAITISCRWRLGTGGSLTLRIDGRAGELLLEGARDRRAHPIVGTKPSGERSGPARWRVEVVHGTPGSREGLELRLTPERSDEPVAAELDVIARPSGGTPLVLTTIPAAIGLAGGTYVLEAVVTGG